MINKIPGVSEKSRKSIALLILLTAIISVVIFSAGCVEEKVKIPETTQVEIPDDLHAGIHDIYNDLNYLELSITEDIHVLGENILDSENREDAQTVLIDYYAENPWIACVIFYDAISDTFTSVPVQISDKVMESVPLPTEKQLKDAKDNAFKINSAFIEEHGYLDIYCKSLYDKNGTYLGYFMILFDLYLQMHLHPVVMMDNILYGDYVCFITDSKGHIIFSSREEAIGQSISEGKPFYNGRSLIKTPKGESGAYSYVSDASYNYDIGISTEKIAAWHTFNKGDYSYTVYLMEEVNRPELETENVYSPNPKQMIDDVNDLYVYARTNGVGKASEKVESGEYETVLHIIDMDGNIISSTFESAIGLNYMNKRSAFGYSYISSAINAAELGGGYIYYTVPLDGSVDTQAYEYVIGYIIPINNECFILGRTAGSSDAILKNPIARSDLTIVTRDILKDVNEKGIDYVIDTVNGDYEAVYGSEVLGVDTEVPFISVADYMGKVYASTDYKNYQDYVGSTSTGLIDIYGGSSARRAIILAENGGGFMPYLIRNTDNEGFVDLWLLSVEPVNDDYFIVAGIFIKSFEDVLTPYIV